MSWTTEYRLVLPDGSMFGTTTTNREELERLQRIAIRRLTPTNRVELRIEKRVVSPWDEEHK